MAADEFELYLLDAFNQRIGYCQVPTDTEHIQT